MKRIPLRSTDRDDAQHLQDEIEKLQSAQTVMLEANRALELGDELTLIRLGLDPARIRGRLREGAESYAKALASDILR
ncbi:hypothetical protein BV367_00557 [Pseudomonas syringae pv. actinidiae]|nr:hypothetical protein BV367_00557 [Pseudomonas syringae pv. actinidiae]